MKKLITFLRSTGKKAMLLMLLLAFPVFSILAQQSALPEMNLETLDGNTIKASDLETPGMPLVIIFWNELDYESLSQLEATNEAYEDFMKEKNIKLVAIYVGKSGSYDHIRPFVNGNDWDFDVYIDVNGTVQRAMSLQDSPHTLVFNQSMEMVTCYPGYCKNTDALLLQKVDELLVSNYYDSEFGGGPGGF